tara:strand:+ start:1709 stop:3070 length:1362 start_codon:yes stop_codon:yes gene_type:complete
MDIRFLLNGEPVALTNVDATKTLLDWLRIDNQLTGTKEGCNEGDCGACTVILIDKEESIKPLNSCILFLPQIDGKAVRTIEGIKNHKVQDKMVEFHGSQCGFCTPGFITSMVAANINGDKDHNTTLAGNLCRCTGYEPIVKAAKAAENERKPAWVDEDLEKLSHLPKSGSIELPKSKQALAEILHNEPNTRLIAGATDIGLWVNKDFQKFQNIAFLNQVSDFANIEEQSDAWHVGAGITIEKLRVWACAEAPSFAKLLTRYGSTQVRNAATLGGNIANGSPIGDSAPALIAMETELVIRSSNGQRKIKLEDFFLEYKKQDLKKGEFLEYFIIPKMNVSTKCYKISKRFDQDISAVCGCFNIVLDDGLIKKCVIAFGGMAGIPKRAINVENKLLNSTWEKEVLQTCNETWTEDFSPLSDLRSSSDYRQTTAHNLLLRFYYETLGTNTNVQQVEP